MTTMQASKSNKLTAGQLPSWGQWAVLAGSLLFGIILTPVLGRLNVPLGIAIGGVIYLAVMHVWSLLVEGPRKASDRMARHLVITAFILALIPLFWVSFATLQRGLARFDLKFFTYSMRNVVGEGGGIAHALTGTLWATGLAALISVPIGLMTAIYLSEYGRAGKLSAGITFFVDVMTGVPSIVAGLFAYSVVNVVLGVAGVQNAFAGSIALSVLMIPIVVRSTEELLKIVPNELREASYALGVSKWQTIVKVVLPTALSGIVSGVILALARVIGETAPLMIAAGFTASLNQNPFANPMMTLPVFVFDQYANPGTPADPYYARAWAGALTLILIVMILNLIGRLIAKRFAPKTGR